MTQEAQWIIDILIGVIMLGLSAWTNNLWSEVKALRHRNHQMTQDMAALQILVAGNYVRREEMRSDIRDLSSEIRSGFSDIHRKMDSGFSELYDELQKKADK